MGELGSSGAVASGSGLPARRQPWEMVLVVFGLPGSVAAACATCFFVVYGGANDPLIGLAGMSTVLVFYFTLMGLLWRGSADQP